VTPGDAPPLAKAAVASTGIAVPTSSRKPPVVFDPAVDPDPVPSPCVSACKISTVDGWCEGCTRTIDEIRAWRGWGDAERRAVWRALPCRRAVRQG
jgi:predicted Fe-S protein YdhL (DUF1289 family)